MKQTKICTEDQKRRAIKNGIALTFICFLFSLTALVIGLCAKMVPLYILSGVFCFVTLINICTIVRIKRIIIPLDNKQ